MKIYTNWQVCYLENGAKTYFVPASVPGNAGYDYAMANGYHDYTFNDNYKLFKWMEDKDWLYQTVVPASVQEGRLFFVSLGIDYEFDIMVNGKIIFSQEGMFTPVEIDLSNTSKGDVLEVLIKKPPKREDAEKDTRSEADRSAKPAVSYGWDWHPRLIPFGLWDDTYFETRNACYIKDLDVTYKLTDDLNEAHFKIDLELSEESGYTFEIYDSEGVLQPNPVQNVQLWWPNGHGKQHLYTWKLTLDKTGEERSGKIAVRKTELVSNGWPQDYDRPNLDCDYPPFTLRINHKNIFCKGTNWVNPEIFTGTITEETYRPLIERAVECNFNIFRIWGGAIVNKEPFFKLCDEHGIMVWQEFPLACNNYKGGDDYLKLLDQESRSIIKRYKNYVSLWCGGNELFNAWSGMDEQSLALRLLDKNCFELDRDKPFIKTSPIMNVGHGSYVFRYPNGDDVFQAIQKSRRSAYVEFGVPSMADYELIKSIIPEDELYPIKPTGGWVAHHAFYAWDGRGWLFTETINHYFGEPKNLHEMIYYNDWLQCEGYKAVYEEARRQSPNCSMALNWCYNEPWVCAANNSIISYPCNPKPAFYAIKGSCRPVLASARIQRFDYLPGEVFTPEIWLLNDSAEVCPGGEVAVSVKFGDSKTELSTWEYPESKANIQGPSLNYTIPGDAAGSFTLILDAGEFSSEYKLKIR